MTHDFGGFSGHLRIFCSTSIAFYSPLLISLDVDVFGILERFRLNQADRSCRAARGDAELASEAQPKAAGTEAAVDETCGPVELAKVKGSKVSQEPTAEADSLSDPEGYVESNVWKLRLNVLGDLGGSLSFRVIKFG